MMKFKAREIPLKKPINPGQGKGLAYNLSNKSLATQLNDRLKKHSCPDHPSFENQIWVDMRNSPDILSIETFCCEEFRKKLQMIVENKNPF